MGYLFTYSSSIHPARPHLDDAQSKVLGRTAGVAAVPWTAGLPYLLFLNIFKNDIVSKSLYCSAVPVAVPLTAPTGTSGSNAACKTSLDMAMCASIGVFPDSSALIVVNDFEEYCR
jgi:hypothetical protein